MMSGRDAVLPGITDRELFDDRVSVCGFLLDTFCLGVKNTIGPDEMRRRDLAAVVRTYFMAFPAPALPAPIELVQHLVLGSVVFAGALGFSPHPDYEAVRFAVAA